MAELRELVEKWRREADKKANWVINSRPAYSQCATELDAWLAAHKAGEGQTPVIFMDMYRYWHNKWDGKEEFATCGQWPCPDVRAALAASSQGTPRPEKPCGKVVTHFIAGASWFPCAIREGHDGDCRAAGTCFKHGPYLGEPHKPPQCPQCPQWPDCVAASPEPQPVQDSGDSICRGNYHNQVQPASGEGQEPLTETEKISINMYKTWREQRRYLTSQEELILKLAAAQPAPVTSVRELLYECIRELAYVHSVENCNSGLCTTELGKELVERGMELLGVKDLSAEKLAAAHKAGEPKTFDADKIDRFVLNGQHYIKIEDHEAALAGTRLPERLVMPTIEVKHVERAHELLKEEHNKELDYLSGALALYEWYLALPEGTQLSAAQPPSEPEPLQRGKISWQDGIKCYQCNYRVYPDSKCIEANCPLRGVPNEAEMPAPTGERARALEVASWYHTKFVAPWVADDPDGFAESIAYMDALKTAHPPQAGEKGELRQFNAEEISTLLEGRIFDSQSKRHVAWFTDQLNKLLSLKLQPVRAASEQEGR